MFQNVNPGLTRRFQLSQAFMFEDFNNSELEEILKYKLKDQELGATDQAIAVAIDVLDRARNGLVSHLPSGVSFFKQLALICPIEFWKWRRRRKPYIKC